MARLRSYDTATASPSNCRDLRGSGIGRNIRRIPHAAYGAVQTSSGVTLRCLLDFLRGFAKVTRAQNEKRDAQSLLEEREGSVIVTDTRSRIGIYGSAAVVRELSKFISLGTQTLTPEGRQAFAELCTVMRAEAARERASFEDISRILFS
jgi:hypothetical protein